MAEKLKKSVFCFFCRIFMFFCFVKILFRQICFFMFFSSFIEYAFFNLIPTKIFIDFPDDDSLQTKTLIAKIRACERMFPCWICMLSLI